MYSSINTHARTHARSHTQCWLCVLFMKICQECLSQRIEQNSNPAIRLNFFNYCFVALSFDHTFDVLDMRFCWVISREQFTFRIFICFVFSRCFICSFFFLVLILYHFFPFIRIRMWNRRIWKMMGLKNGRIHLATLVAFNNWYIFFNYFMRHASFLMHLLLLSRILWNWWFAYGNHEKKCWSLLIFPLFFDRKSRKFPRSHVWHSLCFVCRPNSTICDLFLTKAVVFFF